MNMLSSFLKMVRKNGYESFIILIVFTGTWIGYGAYMWGPLVLGFLVAMFFKEKRVFLFRDKLLLTVIIMLTVNNIVSSLFAIDNPKSTFLSALWFVFLVSPMFYVRFSLNEDSDFFVRRILPIGLVFSLVILVYLFSSFIYHSTTVGFEFKRYTFLTMGTASTPDFVLVLGGLGYGWIRQKEGNKYRWLGLLFLLACFSGMFLAFDRGGVMAFFIMSMLLLSFDYKRLLVFIFLCGVMVFLIMTVDAFNGLKRMIDYLYLQATKRELLESQQISTFRAGWEMSLDHWLLGVGTNNFSKYSEQYGPRIWWTYAHNIVLQWWAENGIMGLILNLTIVGTVIGRWLKSFKSYKYKYVALGIGASFIGHFIGNLTNCTIYIVKIGINFYLLAGLMSSIYFAVKQERGEINRA
jgi:O-antigen ligase